MLTSIELIHCPYCGENIEIVIDGSVEQQNYVEDCSVCCRPIELTVTVMADGVSVDARRDDD
ncbi:MAG: CPXCG motif-containing cysteine-rich protein [Thiotrichales bacterium]|nr:MAG: CPXCG motif-containing cysteine-rich protein [Thiotrichales bacterium]